MYWVSFPVQKSQSQWIKSHLNSDTLGQYQSHFTPSGPSCNSANQKRISTTLRVLHIHNCDILTGHLTFTLIELLFLFLFILLDFFHLHHLLSWSKWGCSSLLFFWTGKRQNTYLLADWKEREFNIIEIRVIPKRKSSLMSLSVIVSFKIMPSSRPKSGRIFDNGKNVNPHNDQFYDQEFYLE